MRLEINVWARNAYRGQTNKCTRKEGFLALCTVHSLFRIV